jgi:hypothetical protein
MPTFSRHFKTVPGTMAKACSGVRANGDPARGTHSFFPQLLLKQSLAAGEQPAPASVPTIGLLAG